MVYWIGESPIRWLMVNGDNLLVDNYTIVYQL